MKNLVLIRHSKAEDESNNDFERKLTNEGKKLAKTMASVLKIKPDNNFYYRAFSLHLFQLHFLISSCI